MGYEPTNPDPVQGLVMSQKVVQFVHNILIHRQAQRDKKAAENIPPDSPSSLAGSKIERKS